MPPKYPINLHLELWEQRLPELRGCRKQFLDRIAAVKSSDMPDISNFGPEEERLSNLMRDDLTKMMASNNNKLFYESFIEYLARYLGHLTDYLILVIENKDRFASKSARAYSDQRRREIRESVFNREF